MGLRFKGSAACLGLVLLLTACATSKKTFDPAHKFSPQQMMQDFDLYRQILEERHPSLYWYTSRSDLEQVWGETRQALRDSMTEAEFRKHLVKATAAIQCGHTTVIASKKYTKYTERQKVRSLFPLSVKIWDDTVVVIQNRSSRESRLKRGTLIDSLDGIPVSALLDTMYQYISADGNNLVAQNQLLSLGTNFGSLYITLFGWKEAFRLSYRNEFGTPESVLVRPLTFRRDTQAEDKKSKRKSETPKSRAEKLQQQRSLKTDIAGRYAVMELNSFSSKLQLKKFFRRSFRTLKNKHINNLILDLRLNGGGRVSHSNRLTRYITEKPFKVADSLYAISRRSAYSSCIKNDFWIRIFLNLVTRRRSDGHFHFAYYENHFFKPLKKNHFRGQVFILSGGQSFSASTLVMTALRSQENVVIAGEQSGGAAYGNSAWLIPDVTLPLTGVRFRLPLFRLVVDKNLPHDGTGVVPERFAGPTIEAIKEGRDYKMDAVMKWIERESPARQEQFDKTIKSRKRKRLF
jgi:hypothetical protein